MKLTIPPIFIVLVFTGLMWAVHTLAPFLNYHFKGQSSLTIAIGAIGAIIVLIALGVFARNKTTVNPMEPLEASTLVTGGIYRFTRNPMYLGMAMLLAALGLYLGNPINFVTLGLFVWYMSALQIKSEEDALRQLFGAAFEAYCKEVRRWI